MALVEQEVDPVLLGLDRIVLGLVEYLEILQRQLEAPGGPPILADGSSDADR
jgi:hypothetical protein